MPISSEEKLRLLTNVVSEMAHIGFKLDRLLVGFKIYDELKGTTDIMEYEQVLEVFRNAIKAMEEQMQVYHRLFTYLKAVVEEGE
jgi:hypothetical protein